MIETGRVFNNSYFDLFNAIGGKQRVSLQVFLFMMTRKEISDTEYAFV